MTSLTGHAAAGSLRHSEFLRGVLFAILLSVACCLPLFLSPNEGKQLAFWIWAGIGAPACGALLAAKQPLRLLLIPVLVCGALLALGVLNAPRPATGALALLGLYLSGAASSFTSRNSLALAGCWMLGMGALAALPSAGGIWLSAPGPGWLVPTLDLSPLVWVCESAGFDWMRHSSVYETAGAGDLGPHERLAWSGVLGPGLLSAGAGLFVVVLALRTRLTDSGPA